MSTSLKLHPKHGNVLDLPLSSHKEVIWICPMKHEFPMRIERVLSAGYGCPFCSNRRVLQGFNDLASQRPDLARQWSIKNSKAAEEVTIGATYKALWVCHHGHTTYATVRDRVSGRMCKYCANKAVWPGFNDLATTHPHLIDEWDDALSSSDLTAGSDYKARWKCEKGHQWVTSVQNRTKKNPTNCRRCTVSSSKPEILLANHLEDSGFDIERQYKVRARLIADIYLPVYNAIVEYDGEWWHRPELNMGLDKRKTLELLSYGFRVVRVREGVLHALEIEDRNLLQLKCGSSYQNFKALIDSIQTWLDKVVT